MCPKTQEVVEIIKKRGQIEQVEPKELKHKLKGKLKD
jgi:hypothetical protein